MDYISENARLLHWYKRMFGDGQDRSSSHRSIRHIKDLLPIHKTIFRSTADDDVIIYKVTVNLI